MRVKPFVIVVLAVLCLVAGCPIDSSLSMTSTETILKKNNILAVTNMSPTAADLSFSYTQAASAVQGGTKNLAFDRARFSASDNVLRKDLPSAVHFNANPPPFRPAPVSFMGLMEAAEDKHPLYDELYFWVQTQEPLKRDSSDFKKIKATLIAKGEYCNIWVENAKYVPSSGKYSELAAMFDKIYPLATNLLGYEYGGGPGGNGGADGDPKIQILVHDINAVLHHVLGYFWGKDEYKQHALDADGRWYLKSNEMEIFYIDADYLKTHPEEIYSTLIHEFQHMINFNRKTMGKKDLTSGTWYNEMLSLLAEDIIGPMVGIKPSGHPVNTRIPLFLDIYDWFGVDEWDSDGYTYSTVYAFGAYLVRNYGGPALIHEILSNDKTDHASITEAMQKVMNDSRYTFDYALEHYGEALVYSTANGGIKGKYSFEYERSSIIGGTTYTAKKFDIYAIHPNFIIRDSNKKETAYRKWAAQEFNVELNTMGPLIYPLLVGNKAPPYSVMLHNSALNDTLPEKINIVCTHSSRADIRLKVYE